MLPLPLLLTECCCWGSNVVKAEAEGQELLIYRKARARGKLTRRKAEERKRGVWGCCCCCCRRWCWAKEEGEEEEEGGGGGGDGGPDRCRFILILTRCSISLSMLAVGKGREGGREDEIEDEKEGGREG